MQAGPLRPRRLPRTASPSTGPRRNVPGPAWHSRDGHVLAGVAGWAMRDPDAARATAAGLRDVRRDLAISLGLSPPYSPMGVVIRTQIAAIDAELARRPDTGPAQAGEAGAVEISRPP